ncbi:MAG TPA: hypothetical protein P5528_15810 [Steroidobacteraceae bacterium]|nr:hypothetical protein [Steroidobacteraceae bacterium]HRX90906.1 hypothetical protein [Steroidobacteraceae bacterium]
MPRRLPFVHSPPQRQTGAALVVGLILLVVLTMLALTGTNTSRTELVMAQNEQFRKNAALAASAGIERAIGALGAVPAVPGAPPTVVADVELVPGEAERYTTTSRYVGDELNLPQSSANRFIGLHYEIASDGTSVRNAADRQLQGIMVVATSGGAAGEQSVGQLGTGLP